MANSNGISNGDILSGLPMWVKAIAIVGVPSLISVGLVWVNETRIAENVIANGKIMAEVRIEMASHDTRVMEKTNEILRQREDDRRIWRMICVGVQKTEEGRNACNR